MKKFALGMALLLPLALVATQQNGENGLGNNTAPITVEVYSDFECPHCKIFHDTVMQAIIQDYVNPGKVYLIHRDFPLGQHKFAREAALYAKAAARFNKYEAVSDALFQNQATWSVSGKVEEVVAKALTPDEMKQARVLIKDPQVNQQLDNEIAGAFRAKVNSTPTIVVTHRMRTSVLPTDVSYTMLRRYFDDLLQQMIVRRALLILRLILGAVFVYAAWTKLRQNWLVFAMSIDSYHLLPEWAVLAIGRTLPWFELLIGILLMVGYKLRWVATAASALLLFFFAAMLRSYFIGQGIDCGCFGLGEAISPRTLFRDGSLLAAAILLSVSAFVRGRRGDSGRVAAARP